MFSILKNVIKIASIIALPLKVYLEKRAKRKREKEIAEAMKDPSGKKVEDALRRKYK